MSKRESALGVIRMTYAENGKDDIYSIRAFVENKISRRARDKAAESGLEIYNIKHTM